MKNIDPISTILVTLFTHVYTFLCQKLVVLIAAPTKAVMAITYSRKFKLNIES